MDPSRRKHLFLGSLDRTRDSNTVGREASCDGHQRKLADAVRSGSPTPYSTKTFRRAYSKGALRTCAPLPSTSSCHQVRQAGTHALPKSVSSTLSPARRQFVYPPQCRSYSNGRHSPKSRSRRSVCSPQSTHFTSWSGLRYTASQG